MPLVEIENTQLYVNICVGNHTFSCNCSVCSVVIECCNIRIV